MLKTNFDQNVRELLYCFRNFERQLTILQSKNSNINLTFF